MTSHEKDFKLADHYRPILSEGSYKVTGTQKLTMPVNETFTVTTDFHVSANITHLAAADIFSVYPAPEQQGDFTGTLPFMVLNNPEYPWLKCWTNDINGLPVPWLALVVVTAAEKHDEAEVKYSTLVQYTEDGVFFPFTRPVIESCKDDDMIRVFTITKDTYHAIMPEKADLAWLTHAKFVNLAASEDELAEQDGWFSTIIANRFLPSGKEEAKKCSVHLIAVDGYLDTAIPADCDRVRMISLYHWDVYSEQVEDRSFVSLIDGLNQNKGEINEKALKPHYLRSGEKSYSFYHSPLLPFHSQRYDNINGEEKYTADGRLIFDGETGLFDISYAAAFNLGKLMTLSRRSEAEKISTWRKNQAMNEHLTKLDSFIGIATVDLEELCKNLTEGQLL